MGGNAAALAVATVAFGVCFFAWSLLGPLGPDLQDELGLSDLQISVMVSVPVLLGSLARIPLGILFHLHVTSMWFLYAAWPFSRLVHAWSIPIDFFRRSPIPYRARRGASLTTPRGAR